MDVPLRCPMFFQKNGLCLTLNLLHLLSCRGGIAFGLGLRCYLHVVWELNDTPVGQAEEFRAMHTKKNNQKGLVVGKLRSGKKFGKKGTGRHSNLGECLIMQYILV